MHIFHTTVVVPTTYASTLVRKYGAARVLWVKDVDSSAFSTTAMKYVGFPPIAARAVRTGNSLR